MSNEGDCRTAPATPGLLINSISSEEMYTLAAFRSQCARGIRNNFKKMYGNNIICPLQCNTVTPAIDTQEHITYCTKVNTDNSQVVSIEDIYGDIEKQGAAAIGLTKVMRRRNK